MGDISAIIPTYERPVELQSCIRSIIDQTRPPQELIVVDDGNLGEVPLLREINERGIRCLYLKKEKKGVISSRNLGARVASGDVVFLLEDDVVLFPDFIEEIMNVYCLEGLGDVGGVGGVTVPIVPASKGSAFYRLTQMAFLLMSKKPAQILPSGFDTADFDRSLFKGKDPVQVDLLPGGLCSFKKEVLKEFSFSERYQDASGYAQGEDRDFSYKVSRRYKLYVNPKARAYHLKASKSGFGTKRKQGRLFVLSRYMFFRDYLAHEGWRWALFFYSLFGFFMLRALIALYSMQKSEIERVFGIVEGIIDILKGKKSLY